MRIILLIIVDFLGADRLPPREALPARAKAHEIAPARAAPIGRSAQPQQHQRPKRRVIVLFVPGRKVLAKAAGTARIFPRAACPYASRPTSVAAPAADRIDSDEGAPALGEISVTGNPNFARAAFRAGKLHSVSMSRLQVLSHNFNISPALNIILYMFRKCVLQSIPNRMGERLKIQSFDGHHRQQFPRS